ncbi:MAG TPA: hypothetical protein VH351_13255 [Bryobacteraceae bacterium]|nr:hypothetical protein [Bryobacteraceae bacterium]
MNSLKGVGSGRTGTLHHIVKGALAVDGRESLRVDEIFGVVEQHGVEVNGAPLFVFDHLVEDPVEAIGL